MQIRLKDIQVVWNVRTVMSGAALEELKASMAEEGQQVPITVYPFEGSYVIKFGHRRFQAANELGWTSIEAVVEDAPQDLNELIVSQFIENEKRQGMTYLEKARAYQGLKDGGLSQIEIAQKLSVSQTEVSLALATLRAAPALQEAVDTGVLAPSAVEPLLSQSLEVQEELADAAISAKTVRKVTDLVKAHKRTQELTEQEASEYNDDPDVDPMELVALENLREALQRMKAANLFPLESVSALMEAGRITTEIVTLCGTYIFLEELV